MAPDLFWVLIFSLGGVSVGLVTSLVGLPKGAEFFGWVLLYAFYVGATVMLSLPSPFLTVLLGSLGAGVAAAAMQSILMPAYRAKNPWYHPHMEGGFWKTAFEFFAFAIMAGLVFGLMAGGLAWTLSLLNA